LVEVHVLEDYWLDCLQSRLVFHVGMIYYYIFFTLCLLTCCAIICDVLRREGVKLGGSATLGQCICISYRIVCLLGHFLAIILLGGRQKRVQGLILLSLLVWCHLGGSGLLQALSVCR